jgi:hypothetical protein
MNDATMDAPEAACRTGEGSARIGFVLLSPPAQPIPSTRIAALNVFPGLVDTGFQPEVLYAPPVANETPEPGLSAAAVAASGVRLVVLQKVRGPQVLRLVRDLEACGVRTVFLVCDLVDAEMCAATSATVVVTDFLKSLYPAELHHKVSVVHDGIERPEVVATPRGHDASAADPLRAVLVTSAELIEVPMLGLPPRWLHVTVVGDYPPESDLRLRLQRWRGALRSERRWASRWRMLRALTCPRIRRVPWSPTAVYHELRRADVGIIPVDVSRANRRPDQPVPAWQLKSENRLTLKMAAGLPVVATPIPAYEQVVSHGVDGFLVRSRGEWLEALTALRGAARRDRMATAARARVLEPFSIARQAKRLATVFKCTLEGRSAAGD